MKTFTSSVRCVVLSTQQTYADLLQALGWEVSFIALRHDAPYWQPIDLTRDGLIRHADVLVWDVSTIALEDENKSRDLYLYYKAIATHLEELLSEQGARPTTWILQNSAAMYESSSLPVGEDSPAAEHAIAQTLLQVERLFHKAYVPGVRKVVFRLGLLMHEQTTWWHWIPLACKRLQQRPPIATLLAEDYRRAMCFVVESKDVSGIFNVASAMLNDWDSILRCWKQLDTAGIGFFKRLSFWWHRKNISRLGRWAFLSTQRIAKKGCLLSQNDLLAQSA
ncbi:hypothetical protein FHS56_001645 [Thermonema lapsum]|uniref:dTDP-4-dehydrorhamnose reductase n=1 Tax=Thermonema lapsum TaxID=28195 RepID=A0A846MRZ8_9BACT|nr:hypothetical protein [Thermonema lapsum]NIK74132.1 hypothetical protein [Thermonema lapsum]